MGLVEGVRALTSRGHRVDVVLPGDGPLRARLTDTAPVHVVPHNPWVTQSDPPLTVAARWTAYNLAVASRNLSRLAASVEADVVISNTLTTMAPALGARLARRPHAWYIHEFGDGSRFLLGRQPTFAAMQRLAPACLVSSDALRRFFSTRLPRSELHVAHYAISVPCYAARDPKMTPDSGFSYSATRWLPRARWTLYWPSQRSLRQGATWNSGSSVMENQMVKYSVSLATERWRRARGVHIHLQPGHSSQPLNRVGPSTPRPTYGSHRSTLRLARPAASAGRQVATNVTSDLGNYLPNLKFATCPT